jgi:hypothetical protein
VPEVLTFPKTPRLHRVPEQDWDSWKRCNVVVEEKVDGSNVGIWFDGPNLVLQSRGRILGQGQSWPSFAPFHGWAWNRHEALQQALGQRFVLYGEWLFAKNRAFYNALPDWFLGFDVLDRSSGTFLPKNQRNAILAEVDAKHVPLVWEGRLKSAPAFGSFLGRSQLKTQAWREDLAREAERAKVQNVMSETDDSDDVEGVYIRVETETRVLGRVKLHREKFNKPLVDGWGRVPFIRNQLACSPQVGGLDRT